MATCIRTILLISTAVVVAGAWGAGNATAAPAAATARLAAGPASAAATPPQALSFSSVPPRRILDTYPSGHSAPGPGKTINFGIVGLPVRPSAVVLNVTVRGPKAAGYVTLSPHGQPRPGTANVSFGAGQTIANAVVVPVGPDRSIDLYSGSTGALNLAIDITGYLSPRADATGGYVPVAPSRVMDTRSGLGGKTFGGKTSRALQLTGHGGVPATGATTALVDLTTTRTSSSGYLTAWAGGPRPGTSATVFPGRSTVTTLAVVPLSDAGALSLYNGSVDPTDVIADVVGYVPRGEAPPLTGDLVPVAPARLVDTKSGLGAKTLGANGSFTTAAVGQAGLPDKHVGAVVLNVTATRAAGSGYLTLFTPGVKRAVTSTLNFTRGRTVSNLALVPVGNGGRIGVRNGSAGSADVVVDVVGYVAVDPSWRGETQTFPASPKEGGPAPVNSCWAVDQCVSLRDSADHELTATSADGTQTRIPLPDSAGTRLTDPVVSCPTAQCQALQMRETNQAVVTVVFTRDPVNGSWTHRTVESVTKHTGSDDLGSVTTLRALSCVALDECVLVGDNEDRELPDTKEVHAVLHGDQFDFSLGQGKTLTSVSCRAVGDCIAVEDPAELGGGVETPHVERLVDGEWSELSVPAASGSAGAVAPTSVSCVPDADCLLVGPTKTAGAAYVAHGGTLTRVAAPPIRARQVSCTASACRAVGVDGERLQAARFADGAWSAESLPSPDQAEWHVYTGLSCPTDAYCLAVGDSALRSVFSDGKWTSTDKLVPGDPYFRLASVSCVPDGTCIEAGQYRNDRAGLRPFTRTRTSTGDWGPIAPLPDTESTDTIADLSCVTATSCVAVGTHDGQATSFLLSDQKWSRSDLPGTEGAEKSAALAVSCRAEGSCVAVGSIGLAASAWRLADHEWTRDTISQPGRVLLRLDTVSCATTEHCVATADSGTGDGPDSRVALTLANGQWTVAEIPGAEHVTSVSCPSVDYCVAGTAYRKAAVLQDGSWHITAAPLDIAAISCPAVGSCAAVQADSSSFTAAVLAGGTWRAENLPIPGSEDGLGEAAFVDVSCSAPNHCFAIGVDSAPGGQALGEELS